MRLSSSFLMMSMSSSARRMQRLNPLFQVTASTRTFASLAYGKREFNPTFIDAYQQTADQFSIDIRLANHIHIPYTLDTDLQEVHNRLMESSSNNNISSIYFESITGSRLPLSEKIGN